MSKFIYGQESRNKLVGVHPKLVAVMVLGLEISEVDWRILEGVRTKETCWEYFGKGRNATECLKAGVPVKYAMPTLDKVTWLKDPLNSKHRMQADGWGHAVDAFPAPYDWNNLKAFDLMAKAVLEAARQLKTPVRWGADWDGDGKPREKGETDSPHFELAL